MIHPTLTAAQSVVAFDMWKQGRDTHQIAERLKVSEAAVYNSLRDMRDKMRRAS